jgi:hypothetical protein
MKITTTMKTILISQLLFCSFTIVYAQSLQGDYFIITNEGDLKVSLFSSDNLHNPGTLIGSGGSIRICER